jgi:hypothetical protein
VGTRDGRPKGQIKIDDCGEVAKAKIWDLYL